MTPLRIFLCAVVLGLTLPVLAIVDAKAGKWKNVQAADTVIDFADWPFTADCRFVKRMTDDYSKEQTVAQCPRYPSKGNPVTFLRVSELNPGYFWSGANEQDIRESATFTTATGWFSVFHGAKFEPGKISPAIRMRHARGVGSPSWSGRRPVSRSTLCREWAVPMTFTVRGTPASP